MLISKQSRVDMRLTLGSFTTSPITLIYARRRGVTGFVYTSMYADLTGILT